ncbi:uncharacterized protein [Solanum lycopersicum]|uniref:uncharacterized protein n=1 Tax=Solanum lycopersicum TaxID=4081 RepID=UPI0037479700
MVKSTIRLEIFSQGGDGVLCYQGRLFVPDVGELRKHILEEAHKSKFFIHPGDTKIYRNLQEVYWWNGMKRDITYFVNKCPNCQQVKVEHHKPGGLPRTRRQHDSIWVIVDRMIKSNSFLAAKTMDSAEDYLKLYINEIVRIQMATYEYLYGHRCKYHVGWSEVGETILIGLDSVLYGMEKVQLIRDRLKTTQSHQESYSDVRRRELEFQVDDWVFLKVSPMKGVMIFGKKWKLNPISVGPYKILKKVSKMAYELDLQEKLATVHSVLHISLLMKCAGDPASVVPLESVAVRDSIS